MQFDLSNFVRVTRDVCFPKLVAFSCIGCNNIHIRATTEIFDSMILSQVYNIAYNIEIVDVLNIDIIQVFLSVSFSTKSFYIVTRYCFSNISPFNKIAQDLLSRNNLFNIIKVILFCSAFYY